MVAYHLLSPSFACSQAKIKTRVLLECHRKKRLQKKLAGAALFLVVLAYISTGKNLQEGSLPCSYTKCWQLLPSIQKIYHPYFSTIICGSKLRCKQYYHMFILTTHQPDESSYYYQEVFYQLSWPTYPIPHVQYNDSFFN